MRSSVDGRLRLAIVSGGVESALLQCVGDGVDCSSKVAGNPRASAISDPTISSSTSSECTIRSRKRVLSGAD